MMREVTAIRSRKLETGLLNAINRRVEALCRNRHRVSLMEVCGTHTMAISSSGIRRAVDARLRLTSGPGCPVCVTSGEEIDRALAFAAQENITVVTFGDMMRVPGSNGSLAEARANGADVRVVYSPLDGLKMARAQPEREFVFLGVGFETTAPTVAATVLEAKKLRVKNFSVLPMFKLIPPALDFIARFARGRRGCRRSAPEIEIDGFILPGHVSTVIGSKPYEFLVERYRIPCCITGFETRDILEGILVLLQMVEEGPGLAIQYRRSVKPEGNPEAQGLMSRVFKVVDATWRGIGMIPKSGLRFREGFERFDAGSKFGLWTELGKTQRKDGGKGVTNTGCRCGEVMLGLITPPECRLFSRICTPQVPVGPCMVSSEGACAAYYRYER